MSDWDDREEDATWEEAGAWFREIMRRWDKDECRWLGHDPYETRFQGTYHVYCKRCCKILSDQPDQF